MIFIYIKLFDFPNCTLFIAFPVNTDMIILFNTIQLFTAYVGGFTQVTVRA
jgi:hypothetical protein